MQNITQGLLTLTFQNVFLEVKREMRIKTYPANGYFVF